MKRVARILAVLLTLVIAAPLVLATGVKEAETKELAP